MPLMLIEQTGNRQSNEHDDAWRITREAEPVAGDCTLEFGRFQVLPRRRELLADGIPLKLGSRAFELLLALLEADGSLVTKDQLLHRVWSDVFVAEENLKVQIYALRSVFGDDRDLIRTEVGRGYRFTGTIRSTRCCRARRRSTRHRQRRQPTERLPGAGALRVPHRRPGAAPIASVATSGTARG
jgi:DNA-binding winged helix-turn-helix (wHTH) protein